MKLVMKESASPFMPTVDRVIPGCMVQWKGHTYIKLNLDKIGQHITIKGQANHCILVNPRYGSTRQIPNDQNVVVLGMCDDNVSVYIIKNRLELNDHLRW